MSEQFKQKFQKLVRTATPNETLKYAKDYLRANPHEIDAWWLVATTVTNSKIQRQCCEHILKVEPTFYEAQALLDQLSQPHPPQAEFLDNPLGLPTDNAPGIKPFKPMFVDDDEPVTGDEKPWEKLAETSNKPLNKKRLIIFSILALVVIWGLAGAIYYFVVYDSDPSVKLNASVKNDNFTIQYPKDWQTYSFDDGRILIMNRDIPSVANDAIGNPWQNLSGSSVLSFFNFYINIIYNDWLANNDKDDLVVIVMQPVPQDATESIESLVEASKANYDKDFITYEIDIKSSTEGIVLGDISAQMILLDTAIKEAFSVGKPQYMKLYFIPVWQNNQHYLFTLMVTEKGDNDWRTVVRDFAENIRFQN